MSPKIQDRYTATDKMRMAADETIPSPHMAEAYLITSLCASGRYTPEAYNVPDEAFRSFPVVNTKARQVQQATGAAPSLTWLRERHQHLPHVDPIDCGVAAQDVLEHHRQQLLRNLLSNAVAVAPTSTTRAIDALRDGMERFPGLNSARAVSIGDENESDPARLVKPIPVPSATLSMYTKGGIRPEELWYIGARYSVGKTWMLCRFAIEAAKAGTEVMFASLEMSRIKIIDRIRMMILGPAVYEGLTPVEQAKGTTAWLEEHGGDIKVFSSAGLNPMSVDQLSTYAKPGGLLIIDYFGKVKSRAGANSLDDWRVAATISGELAELKKATGCPIVCAVQLNREAEHARKLSGTHISQTDNAGMDGDVILLFSRSSQFVRKFYLEKNRDYIDKVSWFAMFEPGRNIYDEISPETAALRRREESLANREGEV